MTATAGRSATMEAARIARRRRRARALAGLLITLAVGLIVVAGVGLDRAAAVAAVGCAVTLVASRRARTADPTTWVRGAKGEEATERLLAELNPRRWTTFHDLRIPGSRANIDHVAVGPTGVWVIDSKATRAAVTARRRRVWFGDHELDTTATAFEAQVMSDRLGVAARPIVAVHHDLSETSGRWASGRRSRAGGIPVVPAEDLVRHLNRRGLRGRLRKHEREAMIDVLEAQWRR